MKTYKNGDSTRSRILAALPASAREISEKAAICHRHTLKHLNAMEEQGMVKRTGYAKPWLDMRAGDVRM